MEDPTALEFAAAMLVVASAFLLAFVAGILHELRRIREEIRIFRMEKYHDDKGY